MNNFNKRKINKIIAIDMQIYDYYQELISIEKNKNKLPDYEKRKKNLLNLILELLKKEQEEYLYYYANPNIALETYIELSQKSLYKASPLNSLNYPSKEVLTTRRIMTYLEGIITKDKSLFQRLINPNLVKQVNYNGDEENTVLSYLYREVPLISESFNKTLYTLLEDPKAKYNLAFITPFLESLLITNNFEPLPNKQNEDIAFNTMVTRTQKEIFLDNHIGEKLDEALDALETDENDIIFTYFKATLTYLSKEEIQNIKNYINSIDIDDNTKQRIFDIIKNNSNTKQELAKDSDIDTQKMAAYQLNNEDIKILKDLIELEKEILNAYRGLASLEIKGLKYSSYENNMISLLSLYKEEEQTLLNYFRSYPEIIFNVLEYLFELINENLSCPVELLLTHIDDEEVVVPYRTLQLLKTILYENDEVYEQYLRNDIKEIVQNYHKKRTSIKDYDTAITNETNKRIISFLSEENDNESIKQKYYMSYITPSIEQEFLRTHGNFPKNFTSSITINNDLTEEEKEELKTTLGINTTSLAINTLLDYYDEDIEEYPHEINLLLSMFRSGLLFLNNTEKQILEDELEETYQNDDYLENHEGDTEIRKLIDETISSSNKDYNDMNKENQKNLQ